MIEATKNKGPMEIDGNLYYTLEQFATITGKTASHILRMTTAGNRIGKLKYARILNKTIIPVSELARFAWVRRGHGSITEIYTYLEDGSRIYETLEEYKERTNKGE
jgi:hypothetical protein